MSIESKWIPRMFITDKCAPLDAYIGSQLHLAGSFTFSVSIMKSWNTMSALTIEYLFIASSYNHKTQVLNSPMRLLKILWKSKQLSRFWPKLLWLVFFNPERSSYEKTESTYIWRRFHREEMVVIKPYIMTPDDFLKYQFKLTLQSVCSKVWDG